MQNESWTPEALAVKVSEAFALASKAHAGVVNKDGEAYILHPARLAIRCSDPLEQMVAILHDVVEDTDVTLKDLKSRGFPQPVIDAVESLTNREGENYEAFIDRVTLNPLAAKVKILDIEDNINTLRLPSLGERELSRVAKYHRAWRRLKGLPVGAP